MLFNETPPIFSFDSPMEFETDRERIKWLPEISYTSDF